MMRAKGPGGRGWRHTSGRRALLGMTVLTLALLAARATGQEVAGVRARVAAGDSALARRDAAAALREFEAALALAPTDSGVLRRASRAAADVGEAEGDADRKVARFRQSEAYARRAIAANEGDAEGHFALARALGLRALSVGAKERIGYAKDIRESALAALARDPNHPGALHVLGMWNAEVMRLNGFQRFFAKNVLGGKVFGSASWAQAVANLERAVEVEPDRLTHRLDLAKIYADVGEKAKARAMFESVVRGKARDPNDPRYQREAEAALRKLGGG
jgi:tetratricopeptide (TPR) repeat protein